MLEYLRVPGGDVPNWFLEPSAGQPGARHETQVLKHRKVLYSSGNFFTIVKNKGNAAYLGRIEAELFEVRYQRIFTVVVPANSIVNNMLEK
jgi:hypothetical protein